MRTCGCSSWEITLRWEKRSFGRPGRVRTPSTAMRTATDVRPEPARGELASMAAEVRQAAGQAERLIETECHEFTGDWSDRADTCQSNGQTRILTAAHQTSIMTMTCISAV